MNEQELREFIQSDPTGHRLDRLGGVLHMLSITTGGHIADVPAPHVRYHSLVGAPRREVVVTVTKFIMGSHHHVSMAEEDDPIWDRTVDKYQDGTWRRCWDDDAGRGLVLRTEYVHTRWIEPWIQRMVAQHFPPSTHVLVRDTLGATTYGRDGD